MLKISDISKVIDDKKVIKSLSLHIKPGEIIALLGPNGAGKTTTIKLVMGMLMSDSGTISMDNFTVNEHKSEYIKKIGYVPDEPFFYEELKGAEFLRFTADLWDPTIFRKNEKEIIGNIRRLEMESFIDKPIYTYSLGMKRKLSLLIALIHQPKLLIMDEPLNGLDPMTVYTIKEYLTDYVKRGNAVLFSTHMMDVAESFCTEIAIIKEGELLIHESLETMREKRTSSLEEYFIQLVESIS